MASGARDVAGVLARLRRSVSHRMTLSDGEPMKPRTFLATTTLLALAACLGQRDALGPSDDARALRRVKALFDCQMSPDRCQTIQAGITFLAQHTNPMCVQIAGYAQARFNAPSGAGFKDSTWAGGDMGVVMVPGNSPSGMVPNSGYILINGSFWTSPSPSTVTGPLIAHEEAGHMTGEDDMYHNTGMSYWYQAMCSEN